MGVGEWTRSARRAPCVFTLPTRGVVRMLTPLGVRGFGRPTATVPSQVDHGPSAAAHSNGDKDFDS